MQNKFITLREKHPIFTYEKYEIADQDDKLTITYFFHLGEDIVFTPVWEFKKKHTDRDDSEEETLHRLAFHLGMVELVSYWKCACSPLVRIKAGYIDAEQVNWWKQQYYLGLGEFFYTNGIETDLDRFMRMEAVGETDFSRAAGRGLHGAKAGSAAAEGRSEVLRNSEKSGCLIPIGGGKDSIVTLELLADRKNSNLCYMINQKEASQRCAAMAGYAEEEVLIVNRSLDKLLLALNREGYLNGHTPFSAIVAFSSVLAAWLYDKKYVVLSNEASANESTVAGTAVNHQYSKSFRFEKDFTDYEKKYIGSRVFYFSLLRPFAELQIARFFAAQEKYHKIFRSCNVGSKGDLWCGHCPKCLFVYIILSPFISLPRLEEIFGVDMLNDESLIPVFDKLVGVVPEKPFECVGTCDEANTAVCMTIHRLKQERRGLPKLYEYYRNKGLYTENSVKNNPYGRYFNEENQVPEEFIERLKALMLSE